MRVFLRICAVLGALAATSASAEPRYLQDRLGVGGGMDPRAVPTRGLSLHEAASRAQRQHGGRVLAVDQDSDGYRVKLLKDGEVRTVFISP